MDDRFLYDLRPPVRKGFGESLYARLSSNAPVKKGTPRWSKALKLVLVGMAVVFLSLAFSAPVRASVWYWIRQIAGVEVQEVNNLPTAGSEITLSPDTIDTLAQIQKEVPYPLSFPAYVPEGFTFVDRVEVQAQSVFLYWTREDQDQILLTVDTDHGQKYQTGKDAAQEIQIDGQPAMVYVGGYDQNNTWDPTRQMVNVLQRKDQVVYWLTYIKGSSGAFDSTKAMNELMHMMQSLTEIK
jgi:hypothetical protein